MLHCSMRSYLRRRQAIVDCIRMRQSGLEEALAMLTSMAPGSLSRHVWRDCPMYGTINGRPYLLSRSRLKRRDILMRRDTTSCGRSLWYLSRKSARRWREN